MSSAGPSTPATSASRSAPKPTRCSGPRSPSGSPIDRHALATNRSNPPATLGGRISRRAATTGLVGGFVPHWNSLAEALESPRTLSCPPEHGDGSNPSWSPATLRSARHPRRRRSSCFRSFSHPSRFDCASHPSLSEIVGFLTDSPQPRRDDGQVRRRGRRWHELSGHLVSPILVSRKLIIASSTGCRSLSDWQKLTSRLNSRKHGRG